MTVQYNAHLITPANILSACGKYVAGTNYGYQICYWKVSQFITLDNSWSRCPECLNTISDLEYLAAVEL